ncbi:CBS domain-containing protein [bacterium]|nr:CBS domain-containing protein [bacterium]
MVFFAEAYFAGLVREVLYDAQGKPLGRIVDLVIEPRERYPVVTKVVVQPPHGGERLILPWHLIRSASYEGFRLAGALDHLPRYDIDDNEVSVADRILDRQIVDISGQRVVRVNDLKFGGIGNDVLLTHVDVGTRGLLRRMNWEHFTLGVCRLLHIRLPERLIAWEHVQLPHEGDELHVDESREALRTMQPADLADIAEALRAPERAALLGGIDEDVAADALQEMEPDLQVSVVNELTDEQASDIIEEMEPDAGADLLADLSEERAAKILELMEPEEAADLRTLMRYHPDSAGGLMTLEYVAVQESMTVREAMRKLREEAQEIEIVYYVYVLDEHDHLTGVMSLRDLIIASGDATVGETMERNVVRVHVDTDQQDIAHTVAHYNLLAVPVVDDDNRLLGMVTVDDAIDAVVPTAWKKRIPKVFGHSVAPSERAAHPAPPGPRS